jgi:MFS family permease
MSVKTEPAYATATDHREAPPTAMKRPRGGMFRALTEPNYRWYMAGAFVSNIGIWMQRVAQDWLVLELSGGSALALGITTGLQFLPMLLLSAYGGLIADRFNKLKILKVTQAWLALCAAALGVLAITGVATTAQVYAIAFAFGLGTAFDNPARQSFVSEVAGRDNLPNAIGLNSATFHGARIVGPALAGLVIAAVGSGWAILANAVSYLAFIGALLIMDSRQLRITPPAPRAKRQIREGLAYILSQPSMLLVISIVFFVGTFGLNFQMTSALMAQQEFHRSAQEYGILGTLIAIGSLAGALTAARRHAAPSSGRVVVTAVIFGLIQIASGLAPNYFAYAAILPILGLVTLLTLTAANASVQLGVDPLRRGRVMALYIMVLMGGTAIGSPIIGWVGYTMGPRWTLIVGGAITVIGVLASSLALRRRLRSGGPDDASLAAIGSREVRS